MKANKNR